jgi:hypothetical protein
MAQLIPSEVEPTSAATNGTYWFDSDDTSYGVFKANGNPNIGLAWDRIQVKLPSLVECGVGPTYAPLSTYGAAGDIAVSVHGTSKTVYEKISTAWYEIGSSAWSAARPTVLTNSVAFATAGTIGQAGNLIINSTTVALLSGDTLTDVATKINTASITNISAQVVTIGSPPANNFLRITNTAGLDIVVGSGSTSAVLTAIGVSATTTYGYHLKYATHTAVPAGTHAGDFWIKTTTPNYGANYLIKKFSSSVNQFQTVAAPLYVDDITAEINGGLALNKLYVQYNSSSATSPTARHAIKRLGTLATVSTSSATFASPSGAGSFSIRTRGSSGNGIGTDVTISVAVSGSETASAVATLINAAVASNGYIPHIMAEVVSTNLKISSTNGSAFYIADVSSTPLATMTVTAGMKSNWSALTYTTSATAPSNPAVEGTLWFNPDLTADIMVNNGSQWVGYRNLYSNTDPAGVQITSAEPTTQSNGDPLVEHDLWIDSNDVVNYPKLYKYVAGQWTLVDKTDQTTPMGIVFGDLRMDSGPSGAWLNTKTSPLSGSATAQSTLAADMLHSDFVDPVDLTVLNPQTFPVGMLAFNTRLSQNNVKVRRNSFYTGITSYTVGTFLDSAYETAHAGSRAAVAAYLAAHPSRWVTFSGNDLNGVGYFGSAYMCCSCLS